MSIPQIADWSGWSPSTVRRRLVKAGIKLRQRGRPPKGGYRRRCLRCGILIPPTLFLCALCEEKMQITQIDKELLMLLFFTPQKDLKESSGLSEVTIRKHLKKLREFGVLEKETLTLSDFGNELAKKLIGKRIFSCICGVWLAGNAKKTINIVLHCPNCGREMRS